MVTRSLRRTRRPFLVSIVARLIGLHLVTLSLILSTCPASAQYWVSASRQSHGTYDIIGADCASVALAQFESFYPNYAPTTFAFLSTTYCIWRAYSQIGSILGQGNAKFACGAGLAQVPGQAACVAQADTTRPVGPGCPVGDPMIPLSQRLVEHMVDVSTQGPFPLTFERYYGRYQHSLWSQGDVSRLGVNWRSNFDAVMVGATASPSAGTQIYVTLPDGHDLSFIYENGSFVQSYFTVSNTFISTHWPRLGGTETLTLVGGNLLLKTNDDITWVFNTSGQLIEIDFRGGYKQTLTYTSGNNTSVADNLGRSMSFAYDSTNRLSQLTAPDGSVYTYQYQTKFDISNVPPPPTALSPINNSVLVSVVKPGTGSPTITYVYDDTTRVPVGSYSYLVNMFGLTGIIDERGVRYSTYTYDASGNIASSQLAGGVYTYALSSNPTNHQVTITNPLSKQEVWTYSDDTSNNRRLTSIQGNASAHCPLSNATFTYDSNDFLASITDEEGRVTSYVNNTRGLPTSITRGVGTPLATTATFTWDTNWRVPDQIVEPNLTTDFTWNALGQLTQLKQTDTTTQTVPYSTNGQTRVWTYTYDNFGRLLTVDGPLSGSGDTVTYTYNSAGYLSTITNELGQVLTISSVNGLGLPTLVVDENSVTTILAYDSLGRLETVTVDPGVDQAVTSIDYNFAGDVVKLTRPNGAYLQYTWDGARRLSSVQDNTAGHRHIHPRCHGGHNRHQPSQIRRQVSCCRRPLPSTNSVGCSPSSEPPARLGAMPTTKPTTEVSVTDPRSNVYQSDLRLRSTVSGRQTDEDERGQSILPVTARTRSRPTAIRARWQRPPTCATASAT